LEQVAVPFDTLERLSHPEVPRPHLLAELLPAERRRDRRARLRSHRVDGRDRFAVAVLPMVDEHATPLALQPLRRHETGVLLLEPTGHALREFVGVRERGATRDRNEDVDSVGTARLPVRTELAPLPPP